MTAGLFLHPDFPREDLMRALRLSMPRKAPRTVRNIYSVLRAFFRAANFPGYVLLDE